MPGPIFLHFQTYARKANPGGNSVAQVVAEATRAPEFSTHVENPKPPRVIAGDPARFQNEHDEHVEARGTDVKRKGKTYRKAIRQDRHTLATVVASYPLTHEQIEAGGPGAAAAHAAWEAKTVDWMRDRYGDQVRVVLAHDDESHPHLHFWMLPDDPDARADTLHPGKVAKRQAEAEARAAGSSDREAVKLGDIAMKVAMRATLDDYYTDVGEALGMTRDGPKRRRLTRVQWKAEQAEAARRAISIQRAERADETVADAEARAREIINAASVIGEETTVKREQFRSSAREWVEKNKADLDARRAELDRMEHEITQERAEIHKLREKLRRALDMVKDWIRAPDRTATERNKGKALLNVMRADSDLTPKEARKETGGPGGLSM